MDNYAVVSLGIVINVIVWDGDADSWQPPGETTAVAIPGGAPVSIGWTYDGEKFTAPD
jgi:hypothetical protein